MYTNTLYVLLFVLCTQQLLAQTDTIKPQTLNEIVISATKFETNTKIVAQKIELISTKDLVKMNAANSADVLSNTGNVLIQKSQGGGGSPIIRGFEANKVVIEVDGVRLNNAIFRGGHLQNVLRIDNAVLDRVEVVYGPSSTIYGSDALGGVMHFITKQPKLNTKFSGGAFVRYSTATQEQTGHLDFNIGGKKVASLTSITYGNFGDIVQGAVRSGKYPTFGQRSFYVERINGKDSMVTNSNVNKQVGTAYQQYDLLQKVLFKPNDNTSHTLNIQYSNTGNVTRYDRLTEVDNKGKAKSAEWYYGPEQRLLASYKFDKNLNTTLADKLVFIATYQHINESRNSRRFNSTTLKSQNENVEIFSVDIDALKKVKNNEISYGAESYLNTVSSTAYNMNINTDTKKEADTRYPDGGSKMNNAALYIQDRIVLISEKLFWNIGARYNYTFLQSNFTSKTFFKFPFNSITQNNSALCGTTSLVYSPTEKTKLSLIASTGYRVPNVDDLSKVFESVTGRLIVPNANLKPEYTKNIELGINQSIAKIINVSLGGYYTHIDNAIVLGTAQFNGQDSILYDGVMSKVYSSQNKQQAYITGAYGAFSIAINKNFLFTSTVNYTYGRIKTDSVEIPLEHIPPVFGKLALQYTHKKLVAEAYCLFNAAKPIKEYLLNAEDNEIYATADGMPAWNTLNARVGYDIKKYISIQLACENIMDTNYRVFASGVSAPGRNIRLTLRSFF